MEHPEKISIRFPKAYPIDDEKLNVLREQNTHLYLKKGRGNSLVLQGNDFSIEEQRVFLLRLNQFSGKMYEQASSLNKKKHYGIQYGGNLIYFEMGTFGLISALTVAVTVGLFLWSQSKKSGRVYSEEGEYKLNDPEKPGEKIRVKPDVSFISYEKASEQKQDKWLNSFIDEAPTFAIEIVSSKYSLKITQEKMVNMWMKSGTLIGLVINPFDKTIYIYEYGSSKPRKQNILKPFTHPLLPGYSGDFSMYADKF